MASITEDPLDYTGKTKRESTGKTKRESSAKTKRESKTQRMHSDESRTKSEMGMSRKSAGVETTLKTSENFSEDDKVDDLPNSPIHPAMLKKTAPNIN